MWPSRWMLNCSTTRPRNENAASGTNQLRRTRDDEAANPRPELDALGVELDGLTWILQPALRVVEGFVLDVALQVAQRVAERAGRRLRGFDRAAQAAVGFRQARLLLRRLAARLGRRASPRPARVRPPRLRCARPSCRAKTAAGSPAGGTLAAIARGGRGRSAPGEAAASAPACPPAAARTRIAGGYVRFFLLPQHLEPALLELLGAGLEEREPPAEEDERG